MGQQTVDQSGVDQIGVGTTANDGTGSAARVAFVALKSWATKINAMMAELYGSARDTGLTAAGANLASGDIIGGVSGGNAVKFTGAQIAAGVAAQGTAVTALTAHGGLTGYTNGVDPTYVLPLLKADGSVANKIAAGALTENCVQILYVAKGVSFSSTGDAAVTLTKLGTWTRAVPFGTSTAGLGKIITRTSVGASAPTATIRDAAGGGGNVVVSAVGPSLTVDAVGGLSAGSLGLISSVAQLYVNITAASSGTLTADIFLFGVIVD